MKLTVLSYQKCTGDSSLLQPFEGLSPSDVHSLYLHIPFCFHKCHYCDFYSLVAPSEKKQDLYRQFTDRMIEELTLRATEVIAKPRTLFVGGGTPTLLPASQWERLLEALKTGGWLDAVTEFTVEANPETVDQELLAILVAGGVNRLSIGAQSFNEKHLKTLERWHDPARVAEAVGLARGVGIDNLNLDLIFAIPGQTLDEFDADLEVVLALEPTHLSCYNLTFEPQTALMQRMEMGQIEPLDESEQREMYEHVIAKLALAGYEHYEISNWSKSGQRCQHNLAYWEGDNWLGVGPAAASHVNGRRWKNEPHLGRYLSHRPGPPVVDVEELPLNEQAGEKLMMGLRLFEGIPMAKLTAMLEPQDPRWQMIAQLTQMKMLEQTATHLRLTRQGLFVADTVLSELL